MNESSTLPWPGDKSDGLNTTTCREENELTYEMISSHCFQSARITLTQTFLVMAHFNRIVQMQNRTHTIKLHIRTQIKHSMHFEVFHMVTGFLCLNFGVRLVSEAMGGAVEMEKLHEFPWVLHLSELKFQLQSNVVPIGLIRNGIYCHRALLFKVSPNYATQPQELFIFSVQIPLKIYHLIATCLHIVSVPGWLHWIELHTS